ncbi:MAG TPA: lipopolysaccharide biosynthesis protein [Limnobacter sp.]|nr:lipopolysaccharide biosynthesis protein [Limnobacter sp.]
MNGKSLRGAYLLVGGKGLSAFIGLGSMLILARLLEPEDYGLVVLVEAVVTLLAAITELQMTAVLIHLPKVEDAHFSTAWTLSFIRACLLCLAVILLAPGLADFYGDPRLEAIAYVSSLSLFLGALLNPKMALLVRDLNFKREFLLGVSQKLAGFIVTVIAAYTLRNYWALVLGTLATQLCGLFVSYASYPFKPTFTLSRVRELWGFSMWLSLANFVKTLNAKMDQFMVGKMFSPATTGLYSLAARLSTVLFTDTLGAALRVISPSFRPHAHDRVELGKAYLNTQSLVMLVFLPVACVTSALATPLIDLALGPKWSEVTDVFRVLVVALCLEAVGGVGLSAVVATLNTRLAFYRDIASVTVRASLMGLGLHLDGFTGLLWGRAASSLVDLLLYFAIAGKVTGLSLSQQLFQNWRTLLSCMLVYPCIYFLQSPPWPALEESGWLQASWLAFTLGLGFLLQFSVQGVLWMLSSRPNSIEVVFLSYLKNKLCRKGNQAI